MQTHCPHCKTHFRITESQISIADGDVRCGVCEKVFNIYKVSDSESLEEEHQPLLSDIDTPSENIDEPPPDITDDQPEEEQDDYTNDEILVDDDTHQLEDESIGAKDRETSDDFFNEDNNEFLQHVIPEDLRKTASSGPHSVVATTLWSVGILCLISGFTLEYIWFNRDQFKQVPSVQAGIEILCQQMDCNKQSQRDADKIELLTRNVYSHPNEKDALMINIVMKNIADFTQAYPVIQVDFSNIRGTTVAARRFFPHEYLSTRYQRSKTRQIHFLKPGASASVTLEIKDPGKDAMTYEFNFL